MVGGFIRSLQNQRCKGFPVGKWHICVRHWESRTKGLRNYRSRLPLGIGQTEIDALATLRPDVLREIVERAFDPYVDRDLRNRVTLAEVAWREQAAAALQIDQEHLESAASRGRRPPVRTEGRDRRYQHAAPNCGGRSLHPAGGGLVVRFVMPAILSRSPDGQLSAL